MLYYSVFQAQHVLGPMQAGTYPIWNNNNNKNHSHYILFLHTKKAFTTEYKNSFSF